MTGLTAAFIDLYSGCRTRSYQALCYFQCQVYKATELHFPKCFRSGTV
jgi:hypothetical protein